MMEENGWGIPVWRAPWNNYKVINGHLGWVRSVAVDPSNSWFCTGSADRTIKMWDLATGGLIHTLNGHTGQVRGLAVSSRHTNYMFSAGDDKEVKCWDLEQNEVIWSYDGHLSDVYCLALHPTLDVLLTGGRDRVCRVLDTRSKALIMSLCGHNDTVSSVFTRSADPQFVSGSHDSTIKLWDLRYGKTEKTLRYHRESVLALAPHPSEDAFASASSDSIKKFNPLPGGGFAMKNMRAHQNTVLSAMAVNDDGVLATAGENGSLWFWDWKSGLSFQQLEGEARIHALAYDVTGSKLITGVADHSIKMWEEVQNATPETHPLHFEGI